MSGSKGRAPKRRSLARSYSLGSSFTRCFGAGGAISPSYGLLVVDKVDHRRYSKLSSSHEDGDEEEEEEEEGCRIDCTKQVKEGKLNDQAGVGMRWRPSAAQSSLQVQQQAVPDQASFGAKVKQACGQVLENAKKSSPHLSELFVGTQLLMKCTSASALVVSRQPCANSSLSPSPGFVYNTKHT